MSTEKDLSDYPDLARTDLPEETHDEWNEELPGSEIKEGEESSQETSSTETASARNRRRIKVTVRHEELLETAVEETGLSRSQIYSLALKGWAERRGFGT